MLLLALLFATGAYITPPLLPPQLAKRHGAGALLPRAAPSAMVFDPTAIEPTAVALGAVVGFPVHKAVQVTSDALQAAKKGTSFEARRVEVCVLPPASFASASGTHLGLRVMRWSPPPRVLHEPLRGPIRRRSLSRATSPSSPLPTCRPRACARSLSPHELSYTPARAALRRGPFKKKRRPLAS